MTLRGASRGPVHDVKQPVLPGRIAENMRRTIEKRSLVQRLDEGLLRRLMRVALGPPALPRP
jgi:hypothetical protein